MVRMVTSTEFRKRLSELLCAVRNGEVLIVLRRGRPIAEVRPVLTVDHEPAWKKPGLRLSAPGASLAAAILEERAL
jgi:prevent-host-death family protein